MINRKEDIRMAYEKSDISIVLRDGRAVHMGKGDTVTCAEQRKQSPDK